MLKHVGIHNAIGFQQLTRLQLGFGHLNEHKFRHNFRNFLNPLCECKIKSETTSHFLSRCHKKIDERIISDNTSILDQILFYGNENYNPDTSKKILLSTIKFCIDSKRFDTSLL